MKSDIPCKSPSCSSAVHLLHSVVTLLALDLSFDPKLVFAAEGIFWRSPTWVQSSLLVPAPGRRCASTETIANAHQRRFGCDGRCNSWRLWLHCIDRTFSAGQWHPSSGGDAGCDSIWGSWAVTVGGEVPLNVLLTSHWINTKKKNQNHNLDTSLCNLGSQKRQNTKNVSLAATHF